MRYKRASNEIAKFALHVTSPEYDNSDEHRHFCLLFMLMKKPDFTKLCPAHIKKHKDVGNIDTCDYCPYFSILNFRHDKVMLEIPDDFNYDIQSKKNPPTGGTDST